MKKQLYLIIFYFFILLANGKTEPLPIIDSITSNSTRVQLDSIVNTDGYQIQYRQNEKDITVDSFVSPPYTITGLKSNAQTHVKVRSVSQALDPTPWEEITQVDFRTLKIITIDATAVKKSSMCEISGIIDAAVFTSDTIFRFTPKTVPGTATITITNQQTATATIQCEIDENYSISKVKIYSDSSYKPLNRNFYRVFPDDSLLNSILVLGTVKNKSTIKFSGLEGNVFTNQNVPFALVEPPPSLINGRLKILDSKGTVIQNNLTDFIWKGNDMDTGIVPNGLYTYIVEINQQAPDTTITIHGAIVKKW